MKEKRERTQINKIRNERVDVTTNTIEIQRIVRNYYEQLYAKKLDNQGKMDKFLETYNLAKLNQAAVESLTRPITPGEIEAVIKNFWHTKALDRMASLVNFTKHLKNTAA